MHAANTFMDHWDAPSEARLDKLLSERLSGNLYDVELGGQKDLAIHYAVRGFSRDRSTSLRRLSENALARGDVTRAVSRAQDASLNYQGYIAAIQTDPLQTRGMKTLLELALAEAQLARGEADLASGHAQSALTLASASGADAYAVRATLASLLGLV